MDARTCKSNLSLQPLLACAGPVMIQSLKYPCGSCFDIVCWDLLPHSAPSIPCSSPPQTPFQWLLRREPGPGQYSAQERARMAEALMAPVDTAYRAAVARVAALPGGVVSHVGPVGLLRTEC